MPGVVLIDQLSQAKSASHARRTSADNDHVGRHDRMVHLGERLAENQHRLSIRRAEIRLGEGKLYLKRV
jgi:hypothetical protein